MIRVALLYFCPFMTAVLYTKYIILVGSTCDTHLFSNVFIQFRIFFLTDTISSMEKLSQITKKWKKRQDTQTFTIKYSISLRNMIQR